ncbi:hypothetical protein NG798_23360 [Ancylothrix sp. C2]|uniref:hypothetical protein n=1 Tax=Ancylothrix sp. D3o TaxID=2953691 RepID=UPI0021BAECE1|nr:hypothetical protein [Ancylothrix sp. D3o]MCT7952743.1 hypothetical protein [Ancylothrix sp. D3o]
MDLKEMSADQKAALAAELDRRLFIAAHTLAGILTYGHWDAETVAKQAIEYADGLIKCADDLISTVPKD